MASNPPTLLDTATSALGSISHGIINVVLYIASTALTVGILALTNYINFRLSGARGGWNEGGFIFWNFLVCFTGFMAHLVMTFENADNETVPYPESLLHIQVRIAVFAAVLLVLGAAVAVVVRVRRHFFTSSEKLMTAEIEKPDGSTRTWKVFLFGDGK